MLVRVEHAAHGENRKGLVALLLQPGGVVEQRTPPPRQHITHGAAQFGGADRVEQDMRLRSNDGHAMLAQDVALDDGAALLRDVEAGGLDKRAGRVIGRPAADHLLGNVAPVELPSPFVPSGPQARMHLRQGCDRVRRQFVVSNDGKVDVAALRVEVAERQRTAKVEGHKLIGENGPQVGVKQSPGRRSPPGAVLADGQALGTVDYFHRCMFYPAACCLHAATQRSSPVTLVTCK